MHRADLRVEQDEAYALVVSVARGDMQDLQAIADRLAKWRVELG